MSTNSSQTFPLKTEERTLPNLPHDTKPEENTTRKEKYRPTSLINTDTKILKKILTNLIRHHVQRLSHKRGTRNARLVQYMNITSVCSITESGRSQARVRTLAPLSKFLRLQRRANGTSFLARREDGVAARHSAKGHTTLTAIALR